MTDPAGTGPAAKTMKRPLPATEPDLRACIAGDGAAWNAFVERYAGVIIAAVRHVCKKSARGGLGSIESLGAPASGVTEDDLVQDVFVRLVKDDRRLLRSFDPRRAAFTTWLTLVARSVAIDSLRRKHHATIPIEHHSELGSMTPAAASARHEAEAPAVDARLLDDLLTDRQRLILRLLFERGMSVPEAAAAMGVDEQTIRSGKHKALSRLRDHFGVSTTGPPSMEQ